MNMISLSNSLLLADLPQPACLHDGLRGLLNGQEASHGQGGGEDAQGTEGEVSSSLKCNLQLWRSGH